jgi:hypothetical protein
VTASTLAAIGQQPLLGRAFEPADEKPGAPPAIILGYALWEKRYGKDPSIVGKSIRVNSVPTTVAGVLAKGVLFPPQAEFWLPLTVTGAEKSQDRELAVFGKLAGGYSQETARAEMATLASGLERHTPSPTVMSAAGQDFPGGHAAGSGARRLRGAAGRGRVCADDRLRECGEPDAVASRGALA